MNRSVQPELLDTLDSKDPRAIASRADLRRLNMVMRHAGILRRELLKIFPDEPPDEVIDLGAGDGLLACRLANSLDGAWRRVHWTLVDRSEPSSRDILGIQHPQPLSVNWVIEDVLDWLERSPARSRSCVLANLFLHHLQEPELQALFTQITAKGHALIACEPRRNLWCLVMSHCLIALGCSAVTRHDAVVSVRAGFADDDLSRLWPRDPAWKLTEHRAGLFSHVFVAKKGP